MNKFCYHLLQLGKFITWCSSLWTRCFPDLWYVPFYPCPHTYLLILYNLTKEFPSLLQETFLGCYFFSCLFSCLIPRHSTVIIIIIAYVCNSSVYHVSLDSDLLKSGLCVINFCILESGTRPGIPKVLNKYMANDWMNTWMDFQVCSLI